MIIKMDLHTHTNFSDGRNSARDNIRSAEAYGLEVLGITDHVHKKEDLTWLDELRKIIKESESAVRVLAGAEVRTKRDGSLPLDSSTLSKLDIVIGEIYIPMGKSPSGTLKDFLEMVQESLKRLVENRHVDIIAHPLNLGRTPWIRDFRKLSKDFLDDIASAFADGKAAVEVMNQMFWWYPDMKVADFTDAYSEFIRLCLKKGCRFSVGSDAHSAGAVGNLAWSIRVLEKAGVTKEDLIEI